MKQSIILKTIIILGSFIVTIFFASGYMFLQNDNKLIQEIREYNLKTTMEALDERLQERLKVNKKQMEDTISMIAKNTSPFLLNFDSDGLKNSLGFDIKKDGVMAIKVWDNIVNENFLTALKNKDNKIIFQNIVPKEFNKYLKITKDVVIKNDNNIEIIGKITLYYDESLIKNKILVLKQETKKEIDNFNKTIDLKQQYSNKIKFYIIIGSLFVILFVIAILLINFVNKPLQTLQKGLDDFFLFLQSKKDNVKKIEINSNDEFGHMAQNLNKNISVSAKLHEEIHELNTNLEQRVEDKTAKVKMLLDNAGQGFLTFNKEFIVDCEYSKECEKLIGKQIASVDITTLLFNNLKKAELFKESLTNAIKETVTIKRNAYLSLLPSIILLNKKAVKLEYKILNNDKVMLILTNITSQKKLEKKVKQEQEILKMIVSVVSDSEVFYDTKKEYEEFIENYKNSIDKKATPLNNLSNLYRTIHTFKGTFSQLYIQNIVNFLHEVESDLSTMQKEICDSNDEIIKFLESCDFKTSYDKSLSIIEEVLGEEFLISSNYLKVDIHDISILQEKIEKIFNNFENTTPEYKEILYTVQNLSSTKLNSILHPYISLTKQLANRLEKEIYELNIVGDKQISVNDTYKPFIKSLIHIFRNSIDHGIELPEKRVELDKDEKGTISCSYDIINSNLQIIISDDGAGIDKDKIKSKLEKKGIETKDLTDSEIYNYIFDDNFTTKEKVSDISGRGVGMGAVKAHLEELDGKVNITSTKDIGTTFEFIVPLEN